MLTKMRVDVDPVLLIGPVVVGVGLSILVMVFGHWLDLFLVSEKKHRRRAREPDWPAVGTAAGWITLLESFSCDTSGAIRPVLVS